MIVTHAGTVYCVWHNPSSKQDPVNNIIYNTFNFSWHWLSSEERHQSEFSRQRRRLFSKFLISFKYRYSSSPDAAIHRHRRSAVLDAGSLHCRALLPMARWLHLKGGGLDTTIIYYTFSLPEFTVGNDLRVLFLSRHSGICLSSPFFAVFDCKYFIVASLVFLRWAANQ